MWILIVFYVTSITLYYQARRKFETVRHKHNSRQIDAIKRVSSSDLIAMLIPILNIILSIFFLHYYFKEMNISSPKEITFAEKIFRIKKRGEK